MRYVFREDVAPSLEVSIQAVVDEVHRSEKLPN